MNGRSTKTVGRGKGQPAARGGVATANGKAMRPAPPVTVALRALTAEVEALQERLTQMEARQKVQEKASPVPQSPAELRPAQTPPSGMTAMQAIMGRLDVEETTEELLIQLKALD